MTDHTSWVDKHRPRRLSDVQGNNKTIKQLRQWADDWTPGDAPQLLYGKRGTGKSSVAECLARRLDLQLVEVNVSDARDSAAIAETAGLIRHTDADGNHRLVLLDEVDSWAGRVNLRPLADALAAPANPVVLTANDDWEVPDSLEGPCESHEFKLQARSIKAKLKEVAAAEGLDVDELKATGSLDRLADRGDLRSAINDLQTAAETDVPIGADTRDFDDSEWEMVDRIMTGDSDLGSTSPPDALQWLDENLSVDYRGLEAAWAYEALSRASVWINKGYAQREYRLWAYAAAMIEATADLRRTEPYRPERGIYGKSFPEWFRHSAPDATGGSAEAMLYRELKDFEDGTFRFAGNYVEFKNDILPRLRDLDDDAKCDLVLAHRLSPDAYEAIGLSRSTVETYVEGDGVEAGEWAGTTEAADQW